MSEIPQQPQVTPEEMYERLQAWYLEVAQLKPMKSHEHLERVALSNYFFPSPNEGTNRMDLGGGFDLLLKHSFNYKVDEADLDNVSADDIKRLELPWDDLFVYKPELNIKTYRTLNAEQLKFVQGIITIKEGSPQLEVTPKANAAGQQAHIDKAEAAKKEEHPDQEEFDRLYPVSLTAKNTKPGQYHYADETWWLLGDDSEWVEVPQLAEDGQGRNIGVILHKQLERAEAAKPKRGRKPKNKEA